MFNCFFNDLLFVNNLKLRKKPNKDSKVIANLDFGSSIEIKNQLGSWLEINYCINEELEVYESDEIISRLNQELIFNNIKVFRIYESQNTLEKEFFKMVNNDKSNIK